MKSAVLVVEDEPLIRIDAVELLEEAGLDVVEFADGTEAAAYMLTHSEEIAAIFTDINLKGEIDGVELSEIAARIAPDIVLLVTSGRFSGRPQGLPRGARFLRKPWLPLEVLSAIQSAVEQHEGKPAVRQ